jgi:hypothetical protein
MCLRSSRFSTWHFVMCASHEDVCAPAYLGDLSGLLLHYGLERADDDAGFARLCPSVFLKAGAAR